MTKKINTPQPNCLLIGEDHFIVECAEILLTNNYNIAGIVSTVKNTELWALKNKISLYKSIDEMHMRDAEIDYLFSIVNSKIIPDKFLQKIKKLSINYHHAPLPKYAGINAPSWAIINNEKEHGISWHIMSNEVDGGDIIKQSTFDLDEHETALSLNLKCYQHALNTFKELVSDLRFKNLSSISQLIVQRTYYGLKDKPKGNGWINWYYSGEDIEKYYRAFYFGIHDNSLSTLKFNIKNDNYIISELKLSDRNSSATPGTIVDVTNEYLEISTSTKNLIITQIITLDGKNCILRNLYKTHNLQKGSRIKSPSTHQLGIFEALSSELSKHEKYWVNAVERFNPPEFPFLSQKALDFSFIHKFYYKTVAHVDLPNELITALKDNYSTDDDLTSFFITALFIYLYKLGNSDKIGLGLIIPFLSNNTHLFSSNVPLSMQITDNISVQNVYANVCKELLSVRNKKTFLNDIFYRYQALNNSQKFPRISIALDDSSYDMYHVSNAFIIFKVSLIKKKVSVLIHKNLPIHNKNFLWFLKGSVTHYTVCLKNMLKNRLLIVKDLEILPEQEKHLVLQKWNYTKKKIPETKSVFDLLKKSCHNNAEKLAIRYQKTETSYQILEEKVNDFASYLYHNTQIKEQTPVIIFMPRSTEWVISLLALMKIHAIYIPVSTNTPIERLRTIIKDTSACHIITNDKYAKNIHKQLSNIKIISSLNSSNKQLKPTHNHNDIAYIMHTSGSTGAPKGVMIQHRSLINLVIEQIKALKLNSKTNILQFSSIGFDASIWEIFASLIAGCSIYIPSEETILIGDELTNCIIKNQITCVTLPPSILQTISPIVTKTLKMIIIAGESCSEELVNNWVEKVILINAYGPTEATVCATMTNLSKRKPISIGKPIGNTQSYILDHNLKPLPIGVVGELYLGGENLALGYLNKPELTKQYFITNPFTYEKIYRSRDLARWLPDGTLEYVGRIDNQIKIRGIRIELEAIETQLLHNKNVEQAVVAHKKNAHLGDVLVAYVVIKKQIELHYLRNYLEKYLPHYMIPNFFVCLDTLPLTNNGKIDRSVLPEPEIVKTNKKHPKTELEHKIEKIWSKIFRLDHIEPHDNFFNLGGNSLLLSQLLLALRDELNFEVHFSVFLKYPTISGIAQVISNKCHNILEYDTQILRDIKLEQSIFPQNITETHSLTKNIFLTGCTGFLGCHILEKLIQDIKINKIYCLIRADSHQAAIKKIREAAKKCQLSFVIDNKIVPIVGDLSLPYFGLHEESYQFLSKEIDIIYHNGAHVNHLYDYNLLRLTNVCSTIEILKLASTQRNKEINYISTLSAVGNFTKKDGYIIEEFISLDYEIPPNDGYSQTKWVSEKLLSEASDRNFRINIYRPGWIFGNSSTGYFPVTGNHLLLLIKSCIQMKIAPNWKTELNILPVDFVSEFIVKTREHNNSVNTVYNLANNQHLSWSDIIRYINQFGHEVKMIPPEKWTKKIQGIDRKNALFNLLPLYIGYENDWDKNLNKLSLSHCSNTLNVISELKIDYPQIDQNILYQCFLTLNDSLIN